MLNRAQLRNLHIKIGAVVAIPLIISASTALLLSHNRELGFKHIPVNLSWLPDFQPFGTPNVLSTIESGLTTRDGRYFVGTRYGLFVVEQGKLTRIDAIPPTDVRSIRETERGILVASKVGVWLQQAGVWRQLYKGEVWQADMLPDQSLQIISKGQGVLISQDGGQHWSPVHAVNTPLAETPLEIDRSQIPLDKLLFEIHTGNALFGRPWRWLWIDFVAAPLLFLAVSGLWLWVRSRRRRVS